MKLFLSYSREDKAWVSEFQNKILTELRHDVWSDLQMPLSADWWQTILENIESAEAFIFVITPKSVSSVSCRTQLSYAIALNKPILPILLKPIEIPAVLVSMQIIDFSEDITMGQILTEVSKGLNHVLKAVSSGQYPSIHVPRPTEPSVAEPTPIEIFEIAEQAASNGDFELAQKQFQRVLAMNTGGLGVLAAERLNEIRFERSRSAEYTAVVQLADNPQLIRAAKAAWQAYVSKYGHDYDPNDLSEKLAENSQTSSETPKSTTRIITGGGNYVGEIVSIDGDQNIITPPPDNPDPPLAETNKPPMDSVRFKLYSPPQVEINTRSVLYVYAYVEAVTTQIISDVERFKFELGGSIPESRSAKQPVEIERGTAITVIPESSEVEFEPQSMRKKWHGDWSRFDFEFRPNTELLDEVIFVRVSIQIEGVEIAHIKCAIDVVESVENPIRALDSSQGHNPLLLEKMNSQSTAPYQRIFISYSRKDTTIARAYKLAQIALGNDAFLDVDNLRSGENWQAGLARAIDEADIFQLFWSEYSSESQYCTYEWQYALAHRCPDNRCEAFIRPVFWKKPMPNVPDDLKHLNFKYVPFDGTIEEEV